jgi:E3 ubiquitin-protein ligase UBR4
MLFTVLVLCSSEDEARLEAWVALCDGIERNQLGNTMKDEIVRLGLVARCTDYIKLNAPPNKETRIPHSIWKY